MNYGTTLQATMNDIRVLLVEAELSDARFIQEALAEIEETTHAGAWIHCRVTHLDRAGDAARLLEAERPDIVLFNPSLPDTRGIATYSILRDAAPDVPLVALIEANEAGLGRRLLREGAQDYLVKADMDCRPLAHAMLNSIERQRFSRSAQLAVAVDLETGLYNYAAFQALASRDLQLASRTAQSVTLVAAEIDNLVDLDSSCGREAAHQAIVEASNLIRASAADTALAGRIGLGRFALLAWQMTADRIAADLQNRIQSGHHDFAFVFGSATMKAAGTAAFDDLLKTAQAALDEHKQAYLNLN